MRILVMVIFFALAAIGLVEAVRSDPANTLASAASAPFVATSTAVVGTIDYQQNNAQVATPYLVYQGDGARTKALVFTSASVCTTSSGAYPCALIAGALSTYYGGGLVRAEGRVDDENLLVARLSPA